MIPTPDDVWRAAERIKGIAQTTPLLNSPVLDEMSGCTLFAKAENLQVTGSFKIRGAGNRLVQLSAEQRKTGVVAFSSGNHAQGVARAARHVNCPAVIVMPSDAPQVKIEGVRRDGADIVLYDRNAQSREEIAANLVEMRGAVLVPSYDDPNIVAGQGTTGLEMVQQARALQTTFEHVIVCAGGGGLGSGMSLAFEAIMPGTELWTAEPEGHDDWARSLNNKTLLANPPGTRSICDAILTPQPGNIPFEIARSRFAGGLVVSDEQVKWAMQVAFSHLKLVLEPGGAVALAAALYALPDHMRGSTVGITLSGGNVDPQLFAECLLA